MSKDNYAKITEDSFKYLKLGNSFTDHFVLEIIPTQKKGRIMLLDRNEFGEEGIKVIKEYLEMVK